MSAEQDPKNISASIPLRNLSDAQAQEEIDKAVAAGRVLRYDYATGDIKTFPWAGVSEANQSEQPDTSIRQRTKQ